MWVRGLKLKFKRLSNLSKHVAPHVGAWIETPNGVAFTGG